MNISIDTFDLSMRDPETGNILTANIYKVEGIDRELSAAQLVMAICLQKAAELEATIVELMDEMSRTTTKIENLSTLEEKLVALQDKGDVECLFSDIDWKDDLPEGWKSGQKWTDWANSVGVTIPNYSESMRTVGKTDLQTVITNIESKLDSLNTVSQKNMIELQSKTNKRDQTYDLITAMVKSIGTSNNAIAGNMR